jgi:hypothetical protein
MSKEHKRIESFIKWLNKTNTLSNRERIVLNTSEVIGEPLKKSIVRNYFKDCYRVKYNKERKREKLLGIITLVKERNIPALYSYYVKNFKNTSIIKDLFILKCKCDLLEDLDPKEVTADLNKILVQIRNNHG